MRKRNGYTFIDMLVVIVALGLVTLFTVPKLVMLLKMIKILYMMSH